MYNYNAFQVMLTLSNLLQISLKKALWYFTAPTNFETKTSVLVKFKKNTNWSKQLHKNYQRYESSIE